jgi:radical SAM protein with 4Fe4S-binding SPASM domain
MWKRKTANIKAELGWKQWKNILVDMKNYGVKSIEIFGGDALLRKDIIFEIIKFCTAHGIDTYFPTNSILMDEETAKKLVDAGLGTIYFSLDDIYKESDRIRGVNDSFSKVQQALENIVKARNGKSNPSVIICTTISSLNYDHFNHVVDFLRNYPVSAIYPRPLGEFDEAGIAASAVDNIPADPYFVTTGESHLLNENQVKKFREIVRELKSTGNAGKPYINFRAVDMAPHTALIGGWYGMMRCQICTTVQVVAPNGDVLPCPFFPDYVLGNLLQDKIDKIWGNEKHRTFVKAQRDGKIDICGKCCSRPYYPTLPETIQYYVKRAMQRLKV